MNIRRILVRSAALVGVLLLGAIGLGLMVFLAVALVAGVLGLLDGRRQRGSILLVWLVVAVVVGVAGAVSVSIGGWAGGGGFTGDVPVTDLAVASPLMAVLVAVPALVGVAIGRALGGSRSR